MFSSKKTCSLVYVDAARMLAKHARQKQKIFLRAKVIILMSWICCVESKKMMNRQWDFSASFAHQETMFKRHTRKVTDEFFNAGQNLKKLLCDEELDCYKKWISICQAKFRLNHVKFLIFFATQLLFRQTQVIIVIQQKHLKKHL